MRPQEGGQRRLDRHGAGVPAHQPADGQRADPADIVGAADALAAQVEAPGGEGVAEGLAHGQRGRDHRRQHDPGDRQAAGDLQRQERHGQRAADDRHGERAHADHRVGQRREAELRERRHQLGGQGREQLAGDGAEEQRGEEQAAPESGADRDRRGRGLGGEQSGERRDPVALAFGGEMHVQGAVAAREHLRRRQQGQGADAQPPEGRGGRPRQPGGLDQPLHQGHPAHDQDAEGRADQPEGEARQDLHAGDVRGRDRLHVAEVDQRLRLDQRPGDEVAAQGRDHHRRERGDGIGADDQLEGVERAGQRRAEPRRDRAGRAAADQGAQVAAPHLEGDPQPRGEAGGELRVAGFQTHRGAASVRDDVLQGEVDAVAQGHAAAMEGVGLDRIDRRAPAGPAQIGGDEDHQSQQRAAEAGTDEQERRRHGVGRAEPRSRGQAIEQLAQGLRDPGHGGDRGAGHAADERRERHEAALAPADEAAQPPRGLDEAGTGPAPTGAAARPGLRPP